ncbi:MAG: hypothetical protein H5U40_17755 [Polyangiaceae bacterium]|nr:hypothetical protein [Polyangiaceae bacterium]
MAQTIAAQPGASIPTQPMTNPPTRGTKLIALAAVLLLILGGGGFFLSRRGPQIEGARGQTGAAADAAAPARAAPRDALESIPPVLAEVHRKVAAGEALDREEIKMLRDRQSTDPDDVRPSLLLAHSYATRQRWGGALERYKLAYERDESARGSVWFLEDLVRMTESEQHGDSAVDAITTMYGVEALPAVRHALEEGTLHRRALAKLAALETRLVSR